MKNLIKKTNQVFNSDYSIASNNSSIRVTGKAGKFAGIHQNQWVNNDRCVTDTGIVNKRQGQKYFYRVGVSINSSYHVDFRKLKQALKAMKDYLDN